MFFFVDESGDPNFYSKTGELIAGSEGCSFILQLGLMKTSNPVPLRKALLQLQNEILSDEYFNGIPSIEKRRKKFYFHAKDDIPLEKWYFMKKADFFEDVTGYRPILKVKG